MLICGHQPSSSDASDIASTDAVTDVGTVPNTVAGAYATTVASTDADTDVSTHAGTDTSAYASTVACTDAVTDLSADPGATTVACASAVTTADAGTVEFFELPGPPSASAFIRLWTGLASSSRSPAGTSPRTLR